MNRKRGSGSGIFLMEMIVAVGFFVLCASVCILAFAKSDRLSRLAYDRSQAVLAAQSIAEVWKLEHDVDSEGFRVYWDQNWQEAGRNPAFRGDVKITADVSGMGQAEIVITRLADSEELFALSVQDYEREDE